MDKRHDFRSSHFFVAFIAVCVLLALMSSRAQAQSASVSGQVTDQANAGLSDAQVTISNTDTGAVQTSKTNDDGFYSIAGLLPGHYSMTIGKQQFKTVSVVGITLHVQDHLSRDVVLPVGPITESVTVDGRAAGLDTSDGSVSTVIDSTMVENMPLNGRSFQTLIMLAPGVVVTQASASDQGQFSVNGERADGNYFTIDGVSANIGIGGARPLYQYAAGALPATSAQGGTNSLVSVDAMQEFRIQTSSFAPEFGRTPGGQIAISTRSGSNVFHGTLFDYFRNDALDANNWFADYDTLAKPKERQNDFGGVVGGPLLRNKTFFFFSYEGLRLDQPATAETVVPDNPSRQAATAAEAPFLNSFPIPNATIPPTGDDFEGYNASFANPSTLDAYSIRVDHILNAKVGLFGRYDRSPSHVTQRDFTSQGTPGSMNNTETDSFATQTFTLGVNAAITPSITNEARANYSNVRVGTVFNLDNFGGAVPPPDADLFPGIDAANASSGWYLYGGGELLVGSNNVEEQRQVNFVDSISMTRGTHQMKFGVDYRWLAPFVRPVGYSNFLLFFGVSAIANGPGSVLSGSMFQLEDGNQYPVALLAQNFSAYGQDTWKATSKLTFTYGLRWEVNPPLKGKNPASELFTVLGLDDPATMTLAPRGTPLYGTTYANIAPRAGAAYQLRNQPGRETVLRAGGGVFYDLGSGPLGAVSAYWPFQTTTSSLFAPLPLTASEIAAPAFSTSLPVTNLFVAEPNLKLPRTYEWNLAIEQAWGANQTLSATYLGSVGRNLLREDTLSSPNPNFSTIFAIRNTATSDYEALQLKIQRRLSSGLEAVASYSFSHSIDIASSDTFIYSATPGIFANPSVDRGNSDFDVRHSFTGALTYDVPAPKSTPIARAILGNWSTDAFVTARTAPPVNVIELSKKYEDGILIEPRPDVKPGVPLYLYGAAYPGGKAFNPAAFSAPAAGEQGDLARNALRGFGAWQADFAVHRQFHLYEKAGIQFRAEMFNVFNHPNFGPQDNLVGDSFFGQSTQILANSLGAGGGNGGFNPLYQIGGPRSIQLGLKLAF